MSVVHCHNSAIAALNDRGNQFEFCKANKLEWYSTSCGLPLTGGRGEGYLNNYHIGSDKHPIVNCPECIKVMKRFGF